jgi:selenocysteine-specific elongation factor
MRDVVVGTAGHIDHGKTLLVKAMTGIDADRLEEEKRRGITLDVGFATLRTERGTLHFVDLPGHERFVKNMLAGATGTDLCLLVVAADESVMPQTVEHAEILHLLGVTRGVVALNKVDLVDRETRDMALLELGEFLSAHGLGHLPVLEVSALTGEGVQALVDALYEQVRSCPVPAADRPFRLPVDRVFPIKGFGTVVTGTCIDGRLSVGEHAELYPDVGSSRVRGLQIFGEDVSSVSAGQRAALNLPDLKHAGIHRGHLAATPGSCWPARLLDVRLRVLPSAVVPVRTGSTCALHVHTQEVEAHVHLEGKSSLGPGESGLAQLRMAEPVMCWPGDRFILRMPSPARTVAGGEILLVARRKARWTRAKDAALARALEKGKALEGLLLEAGPAGLSSEEAAGRLGVSQVNLEALANFSEKAGRLKRWGSGRWWLEASEAQAWLERAETWLKSKHQGPSPLAWVPRQELLGRWLRVLGAARGEALIWALAEEGCIETEGDRVRLKGHRVQLTPSQLKAQEAVLAALAGPGFAARTGRELEEIGIEVRRILPLLIASGRLVRFGGDHFTTAESLQFVRAALLAWASERGPLLSIPDFKEALGITRKHAMPLLEYLDDVKWTRREGDGRRILLKDEKGSD